jgi:hypothetical protein
MLKEPIRRYLLLFLARSDPRIRQIMANMGTVPQRRAIVCIEREAQRARLPDDIASYGDDWAPSRRVSQLFPAAASAGLTGR